MNLKKDTILKPKMEIKEEKKESLSTEVAEVVTCLLNAPISFHKLHLKVTGQGSFAAHKALNEIYDALPEHGDNLAEQFQGAHETLLTYKEELPKTLNSVKEAIAYCNELKQEINDLQVKIPYSEIVNLLDNAKESLNSVKYKLLFLQ